MAKFDSEDIHSLNKKGDALLKLGQHQEALEVFDRSLEINPHNTEVLKNKLHTLYRLGQYLEAVEVFNKIEEEAIQDVDKPSGIRVALDEFDEQQEKSDTKTGQDNKIYTWIGTFLCTGLGVFVLGLFFIGVTPTLHNLPVEPSLFFLLLAAIFIGIIVANSLPEWKKNWRKNREEKTKERCRRRQEKRIARRHKKIAREEKERSAQLKKEREQQQRGLEYQQAKEKEIAQYRQLRKDIEMMPQYEHWRQTVLDKFDRKCAVCGSTENIEVDHRYQSFYAIVREYGITDTIQAYECSALWDVDNGAPLCKLHHDQTKSSIYYRENNFK